MASPESPSREKQPSAPDMDILTDNVTIHPPLVPEQPNTLRRFPGPVPTAQSSALELSPDGITIGSPLDVSKEGHAFGMSKNLSPAFTHVGS